MCVKLMKNEEVVIYDQNKPLKEQLEGCTQILFDGKGNLKEVENFFREMGTLAGLSDIDIWKFAKIISANLKNTDSMIDDLSTLCNRELIGK